MPDLLLELFSEEIPSRMQRKAAGDLRKLVTDKLVDSGLTYEGAKDYWTPRRLVLDIRGLTARSADIREERKGPRTSAPEKAIEGFLRGAGLKKIEDAQITSDPKKGDFYVAVINKPGSAAQEIIADIMPDILQNFPWPKSMRWGAQSSEAGSFKWVRPLQSILCTFGVETEEPEIIKFDVGGVTSGDITSGHRFMSPYHFKVRRFDDYSAQLHNAKVILDAETRKAMIETDGENLAFAQGFKVWEDASLLEEVSGLVEWPVVLMGEYDPLFLDIPPEVIQLTIKENQKCFVLKSASDDKLVNRFLMVANIEAKDGGKEIIRGNAKVVNARLSDAKFFWDSDLKLITSEAGFQPWIDKLDRVTFHAKLGSLKERVDRIAKLAQMIAPLVECDQALASRAVELCKADLNSAMVYEFPELQGLMGRYYAQRAGEDERVASAIEEHYQPLGPSDDVPTAPVSITVALADKLDVLIGFWSIDEKPTGSKDPFALRRAALGVIRLVLENDIRLPLSTLGCDADLLQFFHNRLKVYLRDNNIRHDLIDAVLTPESDDLLIVTEKAKALQKLVDSKQGADLLAGYKRAANILSAEEKKTGEITSDVAIDLFNSEPETVLNNALIQIESEVGAAMNLEDFSSAMNIMAEMREPVDAFFDGVMVNDDHVDIRRNRLALLNRIRVVTSRVADFSKISG